MKEYVSFIKKLPWIAQVLLTLFFDPIVYGIYRVAKGKLIAGVIWIITGGLFGIGWFIDFIQVLMGKEPTILI
ncbi:MAG: TM2 domain-containing protein [Bacilli bacterium]